MKRKMHEKYRNPVKRLLAFGLSMVTAFTMMPAAMPAYKVQAADDQTAVETLAPTVEEGKVTDAKILEYAGQKWYVIGSGSTGVQIAGSDENTLVLLARDNWENEKFRTDDKNEYSGSVLQGEMDAYVTSKNIGSYYTSGNNDPNDDWMDALVAKRTLTGNAASQNDNWQHEGNISGPTVEGATLWPLSAAEASKIASTTIRGNDAWWLRSPGNLSDNAACVYSGGLTALRVLHAWGSSRFTPQSDI